mmetsp:Transcript_66628/g.152677  ORF Transcript_66628/g.152677 Transcript_66628/m.152677 type:complete len:153 (-) Transcript_66628:38-496(-)
MEGYAPGTFGRAYYDFMASHGFRPEERPTVRFVDDPELAYIMLRYREIHDYLHVLTGLGTTVEGEIVQKWIELVQTGLPVCALSATFGPAKLTSEERTRLLGEWLPWAIRTGVQVPFVMNIYFEDHFDEPLEEMRRRLQFPTLPYGVPRQAP